MTDAGIRNVTLEMSLKPFKEIGDDAMRAVADELFRQWDALTRHADMISVLLWTGDGSEILEYRGVSDDPIEWGRYIGIAHPRHHPPRDPWIHGIHAGSALYIDNPPTITYGTLARIVDVLHQVGQERTRKPIRVGATFDPGPEFARSTFKYVKHPEICPSHTQIMGGGAFVCCYATLHADSDAYAGWPQGIPEGTPIGTFLGKQCTHFLGDLGFDYLWLSNGFGFGSETWHTTGVLFDGARFDGSEATLYRDKVLDFWRLFRAECPDLPIETRGTNLATGIDLAADAVPLADIYCGTSTSRADVMPPPNSPWAAIDGDFGIELVGYMSRIAEIPGQDYPFRYYVHDPWWLNSPWLDRYGREPHDIYLPLSVSRITAEGEVQRPTWIEFLTVDNSYGEMPVQCPNEVIPHILAAYDGAPDRPGPLVWVYPFQAFHEMTFGKEQRLQEPFFNDWFMRGALNQGLPLNTVISTRNWLAARRQAPNALAGSVLVLPVPDAGTDAENALLEHLTTGGKALVYGPIAHASQQLLAALDLERAVPTEGVHQINIAAEAGDEIEGDPWPAQLLHRALFSAGGLDAVSKANASGTGILATATHDDDAGARVIALLREDPSWQGGACAWVRGTVAASYVRGKALLQPDVPPRNGSPWWFPAEQLMRWALARLGYAFYVTRPERTTRTPMMTIARSRNGWFYSGYCPDTTVSLRWRLPQGAPILLGHQARLQDGHAGYHLPTAWRRECRLLVDGQRNGIISCIERSPEELGIARRWLVTGLQDATVRFYPDLDRVESLRLVLNSARYHQRTNIPFRWKDDGTGRHAVAEHVTGELTIMW
jgi:hypothetical protein